MSYIKLVNQGTQSSISSFSPSIKRDLSMDLNPSGLNSSKLSSVHTFNSRAESTKPKLIEPKKQNKRIVLEKEFSGALGKMRPIELCRRVYTPTKPDKRYQIKRIEENAKRELCPDYTQEYLRGLYGLLSVDAQNNEEHKRKRKILQNRRSSQGKSNPSKKTVNISVELAMPKLSDLETRNPEEVSKRQISKIIERDLLAVKRQKLIDNIPEFEDYFDDQEDEEDLAPNSGNLEQIKETLESKISDDFKGTVMRNIFQNYTKCRENMNRQIKAKLVKHDFNNNTKFLKNSISEDKLHSFKPSQGIFNLSAIHHQINPKINQHSTNIGMNKIASVNRIREVSASLEYFKKSKENSNGFKKKEVDHLIHPRRHNKSLTFSEDVINRVVKRDERRGKFVYDILNRKVDSVNEEERINTNIKVMIDTEDDVILNR